MIRRFRLPAAMLTVLWAAGCATVSLDPPTCPTEASVDELVAKYRARQPAPNPPASMTADGAACGRDKFTARLAADSGRVVGYKAALTNSALQKRFDYSAPVRGTLFETMIVRDGAVVPAQFGTRPLYEADLVVAVRSSEIHNARTPLEVLQQVSAIHPFIELPDLVLEDPSKINGPALIYVNAGARMGVLGDAIPVRSADPAMVNALRNMTVRLLDGNGKELDSGKGSAILDHPLNAVVWLAADLKRSGITLKPGDLLSLGSFSRLHPPKPGAAAKVVYEGLPGNPGVSVRFR